MIYAYEIIQTLIIVGGIVAVAFGAMFLYRRNQDGTFELEKAERAVKAKEYSLRTRKMEQEFSAIQISERK